MLRNHRREAQISTNLRRRTAARPLKLSNLPTIRPVCVLLNGRYRRKSATISHAATPHRNYSGRHDKECGERMNDSLTPIIFLNPIALVVYATLIWGAVRSTSKRWDEHLQATNATVVFAFLGILSVMTLLTALAGAIPFVLFFVILRSAHVGLGGAFLFLLLGPALCLLLGAIACWIFGPRIGKLLWPSRSGSDN